MLGLSSDSVNPFGFHVLSCDISEVD